MELAVNTTCEIVTFWESPYSEPSLYEEDYFYEMLSMPVAHNNFNIEFLISCGIQYSPVFIYFPILHSPTLLQHT